MCDNHYHVVANKTRTYVHKYICTYKCFWKSHIQVNCVELLPQNIRKETETNMARHHIQQEFNRI